MRCFGVSRSFICFGDSYSFGEYCNRDVSGEFGVLEFSETAAKGRVIFYLKNISYKRLLIMEGV